MRSSRRAPWGVLMVLLGLGVAACSDDTASITPPDDGEPEGFALVASILAANCGACHGATSGRTFTVAMDSAGLVASGLIDARQPDRSLILLKPRSARTHAGGVVASLTDEDIATIRSWIALQPALDLNVLNAVPLGSHVPPNFDGYASESIWRTHPSPLTIPIGGGWADAEEVFLAAAYDAEYLYLLARWFDDRESVRRSPWVKRPDGTWAVLPAKPTPEPGIEWAAFMGPDFDEEEHYYEDKLAFIWNTYGPSSVAGFDEGGCAVLCHDPANDFGPGTTYNYTNQQLAAKKYTNAPDEIADMWHWKGVRQNHHSKIDDQYVRYWQQGMDNPGNAGRASDPGGGGYEPNPATSGRPTYRGPSLTAPPFHILDSEKLPVTQEELDALPVGAFVPNMITSGPSGLRADVDARGVHNPATKTWTLEIRRKLVTGDPQDVQFDDLDREYAFGVAVFDNAQIEHSWSGAVYRLVFKK